MTAKKLLSKITYGQVVRGLDHYRKQDEQDRKEHPNFAPVGWKSSLVRMIEDKVRKNHERVYPGLAEAVLEYLVKQGLLVDYYGDYTFPGVKVPEPDDFVIQIANQVEEAFKPVRQR